MVAVMAKTANLSAAVTMQGDALIVSTTFSGSANVPQNNNAPPPFAQVLAAGNNTVNVPAGFTVNGALVLPPASSTNTKIYKGVAGDTGFTGTFQPVMVPVAAAGSFVINSVGGETVQIVYF
jgi:hypothetical protein